MLALKIVPLNQEGHYLKLDHAEGLYRVAYYYPVRDKTTKKQIGEKRRAHQHPKLLQCLDVVFGESEDDTRHPCPFDGMTVERYIRSTPWGEKLP